MNNHPVLALLQMELPEVMAHITSELKAQDYVVISDDDNYIFGIPPSNKPWSKTCLVAHFDTLVPKDRGTGLHLNPVDLDVVNGIVRNRNGVLGADDRAGVCAILEAMKASELKPFMIFTNYEETQGAHKCAGVKRFIADRILDTWLNEIYLFIEPDRKGIDEYVYYSWTIPASVARLMADYGYQEEHGSYSDVADLSNAYLIPHVNMSVGYHHQHTKNELLNLVGLDMTTRNIISILSDDNVIQEQLKAYIPTKSKLMPSDRGYRAKYLRDIGCSLKEIELYGVDELWEQIFGEEEEEIGSARPGVSNEIELEDDDDVCEACGFVTMQTFNKICPSCEEEIISSRFSRTDENDVIIVSVAEYYRIQDLEYELDKNSKLEQAANSVGFPAVVQPTQLTRVHGPGLKGIQSMPGIRVLPSGNVVTQ